jgi:hypothetical protein
MERRGVADWLLVVFAILLLPQSAIAQECVRWAVQACADTKPATAPAAKVEGAARLGIKTSEKPVDPDVRKLYRVDVTCNSTGILPAPREGIFNRADVVTTHVIAITNKALTGEALPTDAKVLIPVYSVGTAKANQSDFTNKACNQSFFVSGREPLFIAATVNQTQTNTPSIFSNLLYQGIKLFNPIAPLFAGVTAVSALQPVLNGIAATQDPLKQMFAQFDAKGTQTYSSPLYVGETNIRAPYSRTTVTVKEVPSIIQTDNGRFIVSYEDLWGGFSDELKPATADEAAAKKLCAHDANLMLLRTFPTYDVAYGLTLISRTAPLDTGPTLACLGKPFAILSVKEFQSLWQRFKDQTRPITQADIDQYFQDEPPYPIQKYRSEFFEHLRNKMTNYASAAPDVTDAQRSALAKYVDDSIELRNPDQMLAGGDEPTTISTDELMQRLIAKGFTKFGCDSKDTQAAGILFAFPPKPKSGKDYTDEETLALRSWIGPSGKVTRVDAFFQPGLVDAVAKPNGMWCGSGLHLAAASKDESGKEDKPEGQ